MKHYKVAVKKKLSYRQPMSVSQKCVYRDGNSFAVCPRCSRVVEVEFQAFCGCCGQALNWSAFENASVRYI